MEYREFRADTVGVNEEGKLFGVAVPFNRKAIIGDMAKGGWREEVAPGAAEKSMRDGDVVFLAFHDMHKPLARMSAGNLSLREEDGKLHYEADPVDTSYGRDIRALAGAKVLGGVSIGFQAVQEEWRDEDGNPSDKYSGTHRILREIKLIEISAVTNPAYKDTSIMMRDELLAERETRAEDRAAAVSAADRKDDASKGNALPDGSYPIPDLAHLHAAAILAASHHGDWKAAQELIRRRAKELGVNVDSLPGFGGDEKKSAEDLRDDPDGKEYAAIDSAVRALEGDTPDVAGALKTLRANQAMRSQEPDTSTPEDGDRDLALRMQMRSREIELSLEA